MSIFLLSLLLQTGFSYGSPVPDTNQPILLEMGDQFRPPAGAQRIWVQNSKVIVARKENGVLQIKSQALGESLIKINDETK